MSILNKARRVAGMAPWLLPPGAGKNRLLRAMGHDVDPSAHIGPIVVVGLGKLQAGPKSFLGAGTVLKDLKQVRLGADSFVGKWNVISSAAPLNEHLSDSGTLVIGDSAGITSRHTLDCSGSIELRAFSILAGHGSEVLTHSIDLTENVQTARRITIGERVFVGTRAVLLGGVTIPDRSVVAAGAVVAAGEFAEGSLIAGVPGKSKRPVQGKWFDRQTEATNEILDPVTGKRVVDAF